MIFGIFNMMDNILGALPALALSPAVVKSILTMISVGGTAAMGLGAANKRASNKQQYKLGLKQIESKEKLEGAKLSAAEQVRRQLREMFLEDRKYKKEDAELEFDRMLEMLLKQAIIQGDQSSQAHNQALEILGMEGRQAKELAAMGFDQQRMAEELRQRGATQREIIRGVAGIGNNVQGTRAQMFRSMNELPLSLLLK